MILQTFLLEQSLSHIFALAIMGIILLLALIIAVLIILILWVQNEWRKLDDRLQYVEADLRHWHAWWDEYAHQEH